MPLFEVAILLKPTKNEAEDGKGELLIFGPKAITARDSQSAAIAAVLGESVEGNRQRMEVLVRPFC